MSRSSLLLSALLFALPGCVIHVSPLDQDPRSARAMPAEVAARFEYEVVAPVGTLVPLPDAADADVADVWSGGLVVRCAGDDRDTPVQFEYWRAKDALPKAPLIVVTPILGGGEGLARGHCEAFVERGIHAILVQRGPRVMGATWDIDHVEWFLRRAVAGRRAALDWALSRPEVDPMRVGAFGISMGGIVTSVLVAAEPRVQGAVIALAGADVAQVIRDSTENRLVQWRELRAQTLGVSEAEVEQRLRRALLSDPGRMAAYVDPRRVYFVTSRWDNVVPPYNQGLLWRALGSPLRTDLPASHYSAIVFLPRIMGESADWFEARFASLPAVPPPLAPSPPSDPQVDPPPAPAATPPAEPESGSH